MTKSLGAGGSSLEIIQSIYVLVYPVFTFKTNSGQTKTVIKPRSYRLACLDDRPPRFSTYII